MLANGLIGFLIRAEIGEVFALVLSVTSIIKKELPMKWQNKLGLVFHVKEEKRKWVKFS